MYEVEAKVALMAPGALRERLQANGAEPLGTVEQVDTYYAHPGRDFAATDEALRIRRVGDRIELTYKGPREDGPESASGGPTKSREEHNVAVEGEMGTVLERLGFKPVAVLRKRRESYRLPTVAVCLDEVEGLGRFCEVEARAGVADPQGEVERALTALGLAGAERYSASYLELAAAAGVLEPADPAD